MYRKETEAKVFRNRVEALNVLTPESEWVAIDSRLEVLPADIMIEKKGASAFFDTDLATRLHDLSVDSLIVTGLTTSGCVRATVVDGMQYDYPVWVPREAVGDRNEAAHLANLFDMHAKYADVVGLDEAITAVRKLQSVRETAVV